MPHVIIEASRNIADQIDFSGLVSSIHTSICQTGSLPTHAVKTRGIIHDIFASGDTEPGGGAFITALLRIQPGRSLDIEQSLAQTMLDAIRVAVDGVQGHPISMSVDIQRIVREVSLSDNR